MSAASIVITMGDPAGVGPEVICKALAELPTAELGDITTIGSRVVLERADALCGTGITFGTNGVTLIDIETDGVADAPAGEVVDRRPRGACLGEVEADLGAGIEGVGGRHRAGAFPRQVVPRRRSAPRS